MPAYSIGDISAFTAKFSANTGRDLAIASSLEYPCCCKSYATLPASESASTAPLLQPLTASSNIALPAADEATLPRPIRPNPLPNNPTPLAAILAGTASPAANVRGKNPNAEPAYEAALPGFVQKLSPYFLSHSSCCSCVCFSYSSANSLTLLSPVRYERILPMAVPNPPMALRAIEFKYGCSCATSLLYFSISS